LRQAIGQFEYQMTPLRWHFSFDNTDKLPILQNLVAMSNARVETQSEPERERGYERHA